ncbi:MAG: hypothetical protein DME74_07550, partial [Verrucomicrobia bacterium]
MLTLSPGNITSGFWAHRSKSCDSTVLARKEKDRLSPADFALIFDSPNVKTIAEKGRDAHQFLDSGGAPVTRSGASKKSESMLRRYFYDTLA